MLEHRQHAADDCRSHNAIANRQRALQGKQLPIIRAWSEQIDRPDQTKHQRHQPDRDSDSKAGANQAAALSDLQRQINSGEATDDSASEKRRVQTAKEQPRPEAGKNCGVESMVSAE